MSDKFSFFIKLIEKISVLFIVAGIFCIIASLFEFKGRFEEFKIADVPLNITHWLLLGIGLSFVIIGIIWEIFESTGIRTNEFKFKKIGDDKYSVNINSERNHIINIIYGKINDFQKYNENTLVILPANNTFDDKCIDDPKSTFGAFAKNLYPNGNRPFKNNIKRELEKRNAKPFNIGDWISMPVNNNVFKFNIGIVAVTHMEEGKIIAYPENVMLAFKGIHNIMAQKRFPEVYIPLIGSGDGGLKRELSLSCLLISAIEQIRKNTGHMLKEVNIVIYKNDDGRRDIPVKKMIRVVKSTLNHY